MQHERYTSAESMKRLLTYGEYRVFITRASKEVNGVPHITMVTDHGAVLWNGTKFVLTTAREAVDFVDSLAPEDVRVVGAADMSDWEASLAEALNRTRELVEAAGSL